MEKPKESLKEFAVINALGKQYRVSVGDQIRIAKVSAKQGESIEFKEVLLLGGPEAAAEVVGTPTIPGASVKGKVLSVGKSKKIIVFKKKRRTGYTKKQGHRQSFTNVLVEKIHGP